MKADLNLIPKKEALISKKAIIIGALLTVIIVLVVGYFFVYIPKNEKDSILREIKNKKTEISSYDGLDEKQAELNKEKEELRKLIVAIDELKIKNVKLTNRIADIGKIIPVDVMLNTMSYNNGVMNITGTSPDMINISRFMVNLRNMDYVLDVSHSTSSFDNQSSYAEDDEDDIEDKRSYKFNLTVVYMLDQSEEIVPDTIQEEEGGAR
ncbi:MAG: PilN domain-containing protein [Bacillota bacterium]|jgi:Tfp pilus assembly protein PilN|nr:PilN domain-containing protein [Bacillota bacterium]